MLKVIRKLIAIAFAYELRKETARQSSLKVLEMGLCKLSREQEAKAAGYVTESKNSSQRAAQAQLGQHESIAKQATLHNKAKAVSDLLGGE